LHPRLNEALARHNVFLYVHFHIIAQCHLDAIIKEVADLSHIRTLPPDQDLQDAIVRSSLLITDYSSVAWDFLYLDKPVLFYQFDVEKFNEYRGAYINLNDLFGPIARHADCAVDLTRRFVESVFDCADFESDMERWQRKAFRYRDARNCERVVSAILERLPA
jgi:CDP-glycerol glycerophosphotransferase (TagB/SpsB family)